MTDNQKKFKLWIQDLSGGGLTTQQVLDIAKKGWDFGLEENSARVRTVISGYEDLKKSSRFIFKVNLFGAAIYVLLISWNIWKAYHA